MINVHVKVSIDNLVQEAAIPSNSVLTSILDKVLSINLLLKITHEILSSGSLGSFPQSSICSSNVIASIEFQGAVKTIWGMQQP